MTAKEKLLREAPLWSEREAEVALRAVEREGDPVIHRLGDVPFEDEEIAPEEEAAVQEARDELEAGEATISHEEIKRESASGEPRERHSLYAAGAAGHSPPRPPCQEKGDRGDRKTGGGQVLR